MPYEKSDAKLIALIRQALDDPHDPEIRDGVERARLSEPELHGEVGKAAKEIWDAVLSEVSEHDEHERMLATARQRVSAELGASLPEPPSESDEPPDWMLTIRAVFSLLIFVAMGVLFYRHGWRDVFAMLREPLNWVWVIGPAAVVSGLVWAEIRVGRKRAERWRRGHDAWKKERDRWEARKHELEANLGVLSLEQRVILSQQNTERALLEKVIKPKLRALINSRITPSYATQLAISEAKGLAEVFNPDFAIDTAAKHSLRFMLDSMPGGSIGVAGPRGAGKSTLLRLFCGPKRILPELKGKPVLSILVSAPVEYQARDFILYLFSSVCHGVLELLGEMHSRRTLRDIVEVHEPLSEPRADFLKPLPPLLVYLGTWLALSSLVLALLLTAVGSHERPVVPPTSASRAATTPATSSSEGNEPVASPRAAPPSPLRGALADLLRTLDVKPGAVLTWGIGIIIPGLILGVLLGHGPGALLLMSLRRMGKAFRPRWLSRVADARRGRPEPRDPTRHPAPTGVARDPGPGARASAPPPASLKDEALDLLRTIKFQQSYTSGWSGALKLPVGLEGSVNSAVTLAESQMSLPEIVHLFTRFLDTVSQQYQVIIGIDELDKIESDDKAQRFLNEIKSIFGLERCFFLIAVSENAMSSFERRGLPFRDVFDSSFDNILFIDYLNFESAQSLLAQRVVGKPVPFFGLSYGLSGGLARDLIRNFRAVMECRQAPPYPSDLEAIGRAVVGADLKAKLRATEISAKKIDLDTETDQFVEKLYQLQGALSNETALLAAVPGIFEWAGGVGASRPPSMDKKEAAQRERLSALGEELATYIYYAVTIIQLFNNQMTAATLPSPGSEGGLDSLAKARQLLAVNPKITLTILGKFRSVHGLADVLGNRRPLHPPRRRTAARQGRPLSPTGRVARHERTLEGGLGTELLTARGRSAPRRAATNGVG